MALRLRRETALDLTLEGTVGSFRVGSVQGGARSLEVKYLLTHGGGSGRASAGALGQLVLAGLADACWRGE